VALRAFLACAGVIVAFSVVTNAWPAPFVEARDGSVCATLEDGVASGIGDTYREDGCHETDLYGVLLLAAPLAGVVAAWLATARRRA
jgi:hypothetical protein